jgi:hypothetical protein
MAAIAVAIGWLVRERLLLTTHERLTHKYRQEIVVLAERQAARLVARLAQDDDQWLDVIVTATSDDRLLVAQTAETELLGLVAHWAELPAESGSRQAAILAHVLAQQAPNLPADRRHPARSLAQRLIVWPVDGRIVDTGKFIADCQAVLLLPEVEPSEIRVAATDPPRPIESPAAELTLAESSPAPPPAIPAPPQATGTTVEPPVPDVSVPLPNEPARFTAPRAIRISDE